MGQLYVIVNLDRKEVLEPHAFGDMMKLTEFGASGLGTMFGLAVLLASSNGEGQGDLDSNHPIVGSWCGDRIVVAGNYDKEGRFIPVKNLYEAATREMHGFKNISQTVLEALKQDSHVGQLVGKDANGHRSKQKQATTMFRPDMVFVAGSERKNNGKNTDADSG